MSHIPALILDLALILISAGIITLIFKKLKQPIVLGYIVAGVITSPHFSFTPSVIDTTNIQTWADIGVIFLLFALGLDFSFKKLVRVGGTAVIAALTIIGGMLSLGMIIGSAFGWGHMDCLFLGGMIAMSSTSIIYKALEDLGLRSQKFAGVVLGVLVVEDIVAVVLMVLLSTVAAKNNFEGMEMVYSISKLTFFLLLWFVIGIFAIPSFFRRTRLLMNEETMLIVTIGFCLTMVVLATYAGYSAALGAFVMGSILAETLEAEKIERLIKPVKDLFAAIFFVSVGMMVDIHMIVDYIGIISVLTLTILLGQPILGTFGVVLSGQPLKIGLQCGFSLAQIGEFAFIIASLGITLGVTSSFLYPVVVAVSVITTFFTPYMMRLAGPSYSYINRHLPERAQRFLDQYTNSVQLENDKSDWRKLLTALTKIIVIYSVITIAILVISFHILVPFVNQHIHGWVSSLFCAGFILLCISPFLRAIMAKKNRSREFLKLWVKHNFNHGYLVSLIIVRIIICLSFVYYVISSLFVLPRIVSLIISGGIIFVMFYSRFLKKQSIMIERRFKRNLNIRETNTQKKRPGFAGGLLSRDLHITDFNIRLDSLCAGQTLMELGFKTKFGINVVAIFRSEQCINIPGGRERLFPGDRIQAIGSDEQLLAFGKYMEEQVRPLEASDLTQSNIVLRQFVIDAESPFKEKSIGHSGIRDKFKCLIVGIERENESLRDPNANICLQEGDLLWIVGASSDIDRIMNYDESLEKMRSNVQKQAEKTNNNP